MQSHFCDIPTQVEKPKFNHGETRENPAEGLLPNTGYNLQKCHGYESLRKSRLKVFKGI